MWRWSCALDGGAAAPWFGDGAAGDGDVSGAAGCSRRAKDDGSTSDGRVEGRDGCAADDNSVKAANSRRENLHHPY